MPASLTPVEVLPAQTHAEALHSLAAAIAAERETVEQHTAAYKDAILPHLLRIGLHLVKAHAIFALADPNRNPAGLNQHSKEVTSHVRRDLAEDPAAPALGSFQDWFHSAGVPKANAYRYRNAVLGLGLDHTATERDLDRSLKAAARRLAGQGKRPSLALLAHQAHALPAPPEPPPDDPHTLRQARAGEARVRVHELISQWDSLAASGDLDFLTAAELRPLEDALTGARALVRNLIKSA